MGHTVTDCLASTGVDVLVPICLVALLIACGIVVVIVTRGSKGPPHRRGGQALGIGLLLALGATALVAGGPTPPASAATIECSAATTSSTPSPSSGPTSTSTPTPAPSPAPASILPDREVTFVSGGITFSGSYRGPADLASTVPAAVIIGGTGAVDRNGNASTLATEDYSWLADLLSAQGIASLRFDKVGTGVTGLGPYTGDPSAMLDLSYDQLRVQPARDALSFVAAQPGVDTGKLLLVGHSEGAAVAISIAHDLGSAPPIAGLALVEPAYTNILDIVSRQFANQIDAAAVAGAMTTADATTLETWMTAGVHDIRTGTAPFPAPGPVPLPAATGFTQLIQSSIESFIYGSDPAQMVVTHAYRTLYGQQYDAIDPAALAPAIRVPTLLTCGTKDFNTPCGDGTPGSGVAALAGQFAPGVAHFVELANVVHILRDVGENDVPNLADQLPYPFSTQLEAEFSTFVATFTAQPAAAG